MGRELVGLLTLALALHPSYGCSPGDIQVHTPADFPLAAASDSIEVFFLRAALLKDTLHSPVAELLNGFHSGVGFRASNGSTWQFEYDADDFIPAVIPTVQNGTIRWTNEAEVTWDCVWILS